MSIDCTTAAVSMKIGPVNQWLLPVVIPTDSPESVCNSCVLNLVVVSLYYVVVLENCSFGVGVLS